LDVQVRSIGWIATYADSANVDQRHWDHAHVSPLAHGHGETLQGILESKLKRDVFLHVAVVIKVNLIEGFGIEEKVVRPPIGILEWKIVRNQGDEAFSRWLIAPKHIEVCPVHLGVLSDKWGFTVARGVYEQRDEDQDSTPKKPYTNNAADSHTFLPRGGMSPDDVGLAALRRDFWAVSYLHTENYVGKEKADLCTAKVFCEHRCAAATGRKLGRY
jgi:hypothetical protein